MQYLLLILVIFMKICVAECSYVYNKFTCNFQLFYIKKKKLPHNLHHIIGSTNIQYLTCM